jgi:hypothetical protein
VHSHRDATVIMLHAAPDFANAEASSALETNSPSNSDDQAMLGTAYAVGSVRAEI